MKSTEDITALFHHCVQVVFRDGTWQPQRFAYKTMKFYENMDEGKAIRAHSCAGITMEFVTEEDEIAFSYKSYGFCRPFVTFDFYENGIFMEMVREEDESSCGRIRYRKKTKGKVHLTVWLPHCVWMGIHDIFLGDWEPVAEVGKKLLFLGDSITQGMTVSCPSQAYPTLLSRTLGCDYLNQGVGGYVFDAESLEEVDAICADKIFVAYGTNDYFAVKSGRMSLGCFQTKVSKYFEKLQERAKQAELFVITPIWRADCMPEEWELFLLIRQQICREAEIRGIFVVDGLKLVGHQRSLYVDGIHPNDWGASMMALNLLKNMMDDCSWRMGVKHE